MAVAATGDVVNLTFDGTTAPAGTYTFSMTANPSSTSSFYDGVGQNFGGNFPELSITIVPEPASFVFAAFAAAGLGAVVVRRRMRKA